MTNERKLQIHLSQMRDVIEMQAIYEAVAAGKKTEEACGLVLDAQFNLTPLVRQGVDEHVNVRN